MILNKTGNHLDHLFLLKILFLKLINKDYQLFDKHYLFSPIILAPINQTH
jgi:hypothetical protein